VHPSPSVAAAHQPTSSCYSVAVGDGEAVSAGEAVSLGEADALGD
jgi:hypothetical protein